jgi:site-specific recombinase XerC
MKPIATTISVLACRYGVTTRTLKNWLVDYPEIKLNKNRRILTPKQVKEIYKRLGDPEE